MPRLSLMYGCGKLRPKRIPKVSAIGGASRRENESAKGETKIIFASVGIDCGKSIRQEAPRASAGGFTCVVFPATAKPLVEQQQEKRRVRILARRGGEER